MNPNTVIFGILIAMILGTICGLLLGVSLCKVAAKKVPEPLTPKKVQSMRGLMDNTFESPAGAAPARGPSADMSMLYSEEM